MIDISPYVTPDEVRIPASISFGAITCNECSDTHGYYAEFQILFWGLAVVWYFEAPEVEL